MPSTGNNRIERPVWMKIKLVELESEMQAAFALRIQVFVLEQSVPEDEELDEYDSTAMHAIAIFNEETAWKWCKHIFC